MTTKIFTIADVPDELAADWTAHLRAFDAAHPGCHFEVFVEPPNITMAEVVRLVQTKPGLTFSEIFELPRRP